MLMLILFLAFLAQTTTTSSFDPLQNVRTMSGLMYQIIGYLIVIAVPLLLIYAFLKSTLSVFNKR